MKLAVPRIFVPGRTLPAAWLNECFNAVKSVINALDTTNLAANAGIKGTQLASAPDGITGGKVNDLTLTVGKFALGAGVRQHVSLPVTAGAVFSTLAEVPLATFPAVTTVGGRVRISGSWSLCAFKAAVNQNPTLLLRVYRDTTVIYTLTVNVSIGMGLGVLFTQIPFPAMLEDPAIVTVAPGTYIYKITATPSDTSTTYFTPAANAGRVHLEELP